MERDSRHQCLIYDGPPSKQLSALAATIKRKLGESYRCLYLNSRPMVAGIRSYLSMIDLDVAREIAEDRLILSSESTLSSAGSFDVDLMLMKLETALDQAIKDGYKGLWATGDMTWEFGPEKNFAKLTEYELRLDEFMRKRPQLAGICQYHRDTLPHGVAQEALLRHPMVFVNETLSRINPQYVQRSDWR